MIMILYPLYGMAAFAAMCAVLYMARLLGLVSRIRRRRREICSKQVKPESDIPERDCKLMVVLGSGGHTAEMLNLVQDAIHRVKGQTKVVYLVGVTDKHSIEKAVKLHTETDDEAMKAAKVWLHRLPRAREVGQSWLSSIPSTLRTAKAAMRIVAAEKADVVICNGPANSCVVAICSLLLRAWAGGEWGRVIYVESFARVTSLSLSGRLVYMFADRFLVQWKELTTYKLAEFYGRLC